MNTTEKATTISSSNVTVRVHGEVTNIEEKCRKFMEKVDRDVKRGNAQRPDRSKIHTLDAD